ncbi:ABC-2 transporter permease [Paenibacillus sp. MER TA 81-3]|uniref:ABC-2 transporter permease n=1 Tax=Paenibacillus sp. MER TA 81-3 TaxID=2939573 RepID=UPI00203E054C|nr:ABC-2 transporter permease [Paenibacillus sp. MER TA 81-3]MCM3339213.1 ABC-2 transporter permease [Paenibacillus sp. MER TA 81-3]
MLLHLVKKDFLLSKRYMKVMLIASFGIPIFMTFKVDFISGGFFPFFLSTLYIQYLLFNSVSMLEYKYKGSALLCATPYTRKALVKSKYLFILAIFVCCYIVYTITALLIAGKIEMLSISESGLSLLILSIIFGAIIPVQYYFGYEKSKYIFMFFIFITPFVFPFIIKVVQANNISFQMMLPFPKIVQELFPFLLALVIGLISMTVSIRIYSKKNL